MVTIELGQNAEAGFPNYIELCRPFLVKHKVEDATAVLIRQPNSYLFFGDDGSITYLNEERGSDISGSLYIRKHYDFIRFLDGYDKVTFTGC